MLDLQLAAGATEIYVGLVSEPLKVLTFNAHARMRDEHPTQVNSPALLGDIITDAHAKGVTVHFSANIAYLPAALHAAYVTHVQTAVALGVDTVLVANLGLMRLLREAGLTIPLVAAGYMGVTTTAFARYLQTALGVVRVVLPHAMTLDEIAAFAAIPGLEIEVQVQTGAGNSCGRCMMADSPVKPEIGLGCRAGYTVRAPDGTTTHGLPFLDGATDCALCNVTDLMAIGVHAIKIPGRESPNVRTNAKITQMYRKAIHDAVAGKPLDVTIQEIDQVELMWQMNWVPRFCENLRCRFRDTPTTQSYI
ncbi:MAG TPA: U32 family peptidase [Herpetosiphonaceae bacterium]